MSYIIFCLDGWMNGILIKINASVVALLLLFLWYLAPTSSLRNNKDTRKLETVHPHQVLTNPCNGSKQLLIAFTCIGDLLCA